MTIPSLDATDKVVVVTGGSKGLGRAMALGFAEAGADVVVASRKLEPCEEVAAEIRTRGGRALAVRCHVAHWDDCAALVDATVAEFGRIDVLVNNAGIAPVPPSLREVTSELFDKTIGVNLKGPLRLTGLAAEHMAAGGSIINISSKASLHPTAFTVVYATAKAGLTRSPKRPPTSSGPRGIRVNAIVCGTFHTDSLHASLPSLELQAQMAECRPGPNRLRGGDRGHRTVPGERRIVLPDRRTHLPRRRLIEQSPSGRSWSPRVRRRPDLGNAQIPEHSATPFLLKCPKSWLECPNPHWATPPESACPNQSARRAVEETVADIIGNSEATPPTEIVGRSWCRHRDRSEKWPSTKDFPD